MQIKRSNHVWMFELVQNSSGEKFELGREL